MNSKLAVRIVEIDKTLISKKAKYNKGKRYPEVWMFGGIERKTNKWFAVILEDKTEKLELATLKNI